MRGSVVAGGLGTGLAVGMAVAMAGCTPSESILPAASAPPNFVFVLIDTLRADHVGVYGYERGTTPFIDSLARKGLVFENVVAQARWTGASMASIWTSRYPSEVGAGVLPNDAGQRFLGKTGSSRLRGDVPTVSQVLLRHGYRTMALVSNVYAGGYFGLLRGYAVARQEQIDAGLLTDAAIVVLDEELAKGDAGPFFLYIHYLDAHEPTFPPPRHREKFPARDGKPHTRAYARWRFGKGLDPNDPEFQSFRDHKVSLYDASLHYIDEQVGRLAGHLEKVGLLGETVFVIASDHGEEFWDHAQFERDHHLDPRGLAGIGHGQSLFGELTDVPLIVSGPGVPAGRVSSVVRNLDLAPTLYGLAGVPSDGLDLRGVDLLSVARGGEEDSLDAFSESISYGVEAKSLERDGWKLIRYSDTKQDQREFLYDRRTDRRERRDRSLDRAELASGLSAALDTVLEDMQGLRGSKTTMDEKTRRQLEAIGYLE